MGAVRVDLSDDGDHSGVVADLCLLGPSVLESVQIVEASALDPLGRSAGLEKQMQCVSLDCLPEKRLSPGRLAQGHRQGP